MTFSRGHALIVGIGSYARRTPPGSALPANAANSVALRLADILVGAYGGYRLGQVRLLLDAAATRSNMLNALNDLARRTRPDDVVFLYFNGLAGYDQRGVYHFLPYDTGPLSDAAFEPPAGSQTGIGMVELLWLLSAIRCKHVFLIFDVPVVTGPPGALAQLSAFHLERMRPETALAILATGEGRIMLLPPTTPPDPTSRLTLFSTLLMRGLAEQRMPATRRSINVLDLYRLIYQGCAPADLPAGEFGDWSPELAMLNGTRPFEVAGPDDVVPAASVAPPASLEPTPSTGLPGPEPFEPPSDLPGLRIVDPAWARDVLEKQIRQRHTSAHARPPSADRAAQDTPLEAAAEPETNGAKGVTASEPTPPEASPTAGKDTGALTQPVSAQVNTGGGAYIGGNVSVGSGSFIGRDQINGTVIHAENATGFINNPTGPVTQIYGTQINQITVQPAPDAPNITGILSLRLDAAVPAQVFVGEPFRLAVAIRLPTSAPLAVSGLPQTFVDEFPALKIDEQPFLKLRLQVQTSDGYRVVGPDHHDVIYIIGRDSSTFYFELVMQRSGQVDIIIDVLQDLSSLGSARVLAEVQAGRAPGGQVVATVESKP